MREASLTLFELNTLVRQAIEGTLNREYWVEAELSECRESHGHCYMELVQKADANATPIARASAKCWRTQWIALQPYFLRTAGQPLHAGLKVRLKVYPQFHQAYGFSWIVTDIDPTFTLGDMARRRQEIINQLKAEGVFDLQKELRLPLFCQRIAVISSETAAGYGDFLSQLNNNQLGLSFHTRLFPAIMQGDGVEQSIANALEQIWSEVVGAQNPDALPLGEGEDEAAFDCVVIIRGGGATADLSGFDTLTLAEHVANFPLPIITGIGHDRDECILDMVSHIRVKTPTAAAALLIDNLKQVLDNVNNAQALITRYAQQKVTTLSTLLSALNTRLSTASSHLTVKRSRLDALQADLSHHVQLKLSTLSAQLTTVASLLSPLSTRNISERTHRLELLSEKIKLLDPALLLRRGYSITTKDGHTIRDASLLHPGDEIVTRLACGTVLSEVK